MEELLKLNQNKMSTACDMSDFKQFLTSINNSVSELVTGQKKLIEKVNNLENDVLQLQITTNQSLDNMDKKLENVDKRLENMDKKLDKCFNMKGGLFELIINLYVKNNMAVEPTVVKSLSDLCALINHEVKHELLNVNDVAEKACLKLKAAPHEVWDELIAEFCYLYNRSDLTQISCKSKQAQSIEIDAIHVDCDDETMVFVSVAEAKRTYKPKSILQVVRELWLLGTVLRLSDKNYNLSGQIFVKDRGSYQFEKFSDMLSNFQLGQEMISIKITAVSN